MCTNKYKNYNIEAIDRFRTEHTARLESIAFNQIRM